MEFNFGHQSHSVLDLKSLLGVIMAILLVFSVVKGVTVNPHPNKHAVLTILSEDGDIVDCVDIYKQPALDHPLLKNHTVEMLPSFLPTIAKGNASRYPVQPWHKSGICPKKTVPILRAPTTNLTFIPNGEFSYCKVEVARAETYLKEDDGPYLGTTGIISAWSIHVEQREWSLNSVTVFNKKGSFIEIGWGVSPVLFSDQKPRVFINWLDKTKDQGCFNLRCPGFVQVSQRIMLGSPLPNVSIFDGQQFDYEFTIFKDVSKGVWWAMYQGEAIGYWPTNIFDNFEVLGYANWGGSVCNSRFPGFHTNTEMGSGALAIHQYRRSSYVRRILLLDENRKFVHLKRAFLTKKCDKCYSVLFSVKFVPDPGLSVYYGGPGGRDCEAECKKSLP